MPITVGLRVDIDTFTGTRDGVPNLLQILARNDIKATFFFTLGPDNMGRHLRRLLRPAFLIKMLRSRAASLYGWDILMRGTLWPGPVIGERLADVIRAADAGGHEVGLHAWDHHRWQMHIDDMGRDGIAEELRRGADMFERILHRHATCSAAAGWRCNEEALLEKEALDFEYNSDCRGKSIFRPMVDETPRTVQVPVTLPTYDEVIGRNGLDDNNYNDYLLSLMRPDELNVLTIHAEVEGIARADLFRKFLVTAQDSGIQFVPLSHLLADVASVPVDRIVQANTEGREGSVCWQASAARSAA